MCLFLSFIPIFLQQFQRMDYLGYNYYLQAHIESDQDDMPQQDYLSVEGYFAFQNIPDLDDSPFDDKKKEESTLEVTDQIQQQQPSTSEKSPPLPKPADKTQIIFQQKFIEKYRETFKGSKDDTVQLNINFKTLLVHYFRELKLLNQLNQYEVTHLNEFNARVPSFLSLMLFYQNTEPNRGIREKSLEFFSSKECIRRILNGRCKMKNKLQMIKFIQKMRLNILTEGKGYKWKDVIKKG